jgi:hypothetical protein
MRSTVYLDVTPYSQVEVHRSFGISYCLHIQGKQSSFPVKSNCVGFEVLAAVTVKSIVFPDMTPCSQVEVDRSFGGTYCPLIQGTYEYSSLHILYNCAGFVVLIADTVGSIVFQDVTPCISISDRRFWKCSASVFRATVSLLLASCSLLA